MDKIIEKELSYELVGIFFEIQGELGRFCRERQYADVLEKKLIERKIKYQREVPVEIGDRKSNFIDFIIEDKILVDLKTKPFIKKEDYYQMKRYLEITGFELGLVVNLRDEYLKPRRVLNGKSIQKKQFVDSDKKFVALDRSKGFTLIELLVAMTLFLVLIGIATGGFIRALRTQRATVDLMSVNDNAALTLEQIARELRTGSYFSKTPDNQLRFVNANGKVIYYKLNVGAGAIERGTGDAPNTIYKRLTADNVKVRNLNFILLGDVAYPPRITISISVTSNNPYLENISTSIQTTISSRAI